MTAALAAAQPDDDRPPVKGRYVLDGVEVDLKAWCAEQEAKSPPIPESQKSLLRVILSDGGQ